MTNFGPKRLDFLKPFFSEIEKKSADTNSSIRSECMNFYKEAMKWLGDVLVKNYTKNLKKQQQDELDKFYAEWPKEPMVPLKGGEATNAAGGSKAGGGGGGQVDLYEIVDAVDAFKNF